jgi:hypothetical protein
MLLAFSRANLLTESGTGRRKSSLRLARFGITPKLLWEAQDYVVVWFANARTFPRRTLWKLALPGSNDPNDLNRAELLEELWETIRDYFKRDGN